MPVRMTGMISGMDTESLIKGMVDAQRLKNKRVEDKSTLLGWKQDKWKELNQKLYKLYTDDLSKMRLQGNYQTKKATSSDTRVSVTAGTTAPNGSHLISIEQLASSQYVTSGKIADDVTAKTTLKDLGMIGSATGSLVVQIQNGDTKRNFVVDDKTTLGNFIDALKEAGLNANFDTTQKRLFISSKNSGYDSKFTITTGEMSTAGVDALNNIKSLINYAGIGSAGQTKVLNAINVLEGKNISDSLYNNVMSKAPGEKITGSDAEEQKIIDALVVLRDYAIKKVESDTKADAIKQIKDGIKASLISKYTDPNDETFIKLKAEVQSDVDNGILPSDTTPEQVERIAKERYAVLDNLKAQVASSIDSGKIKVPDDKTREEFIDEQAQTAYDTLIPQDKANMFISLAEKEYKSTETIEVDGKTITKAADYQNKVKEIYDSAINGNIATALTDVNNGLVANVKNYFANSAITDIPGNSKLQNIGLDEITGAVHDATSASGYSVVAAKDSIVTVDGAQLIGKTNTITANGLTITATGTTAPGETISFNVANNTQETYDMIKNFIKSYNAILKEMNELYYAPSSRGYDPLSDDEKEAMTDGQIEKWEKKIQDSILRRDNTLSSVLSTMKSAMMTRVEVDGKYYSLSSFGIQTSSDYTEKGLLHIHGDKEDGLFSALDDKLMKALEEDPETVIKVLSQVSMALYEAMGEKMSSIPNVRSAYTFYNDKTMAKQQTDYKKQIALLENKVIAMENKYYKQFAAMETTLAKMQQQTNALAGMLGMKQ
ncbi:flagellar filament capping protein FliD [Anaerocolumna aminovalerica]|uniref:flagellar filament capping protein FliD n=1 Tax=Anaerocolumna aminovalerica TaxID=1527 RepID=UPI000BE304F2|nr:flagellar filament capping protein FliD [Anaerocolumna aminovalerica]